jgi:glycerol uptake facilitator protein
MNTTEVTEVQDRGPAAYIAEFIGTLLLVFFITAAVSLYVTTPSQQNPAPFIDFSVIGLVHVFVLFGLIQTLAVISGAHFNPAITAALAALRQINLIDAAIYVVAQLAGGVAGALLTKALLLDEGKGVNYGATLVSSRLDGAILPGMVVEALGTFFLVWVVVGVAVNPRATKEWAALAIGAALGMGVMVLAPLTGAGFNPARAFGPAIVSGEFGGADNFLLVYVLAPVVGALVAGFLYFTLVIAPGKRGVGGVEPVG